MKRSVIRDNRGVLLLVVTSDEGDTQEDCRKGFYEVFRHYTKYGYVYPAGVQTMGGSVRMLFRFDDNTLAMKLGEDGFYKQVEYEEADRYIEV